MGISTTSFALVKTLKHTKRLGLNVLVIFPERELHRGLLGEEQADYMPPER